MQYGGKNILLIDLGGTNLRAAFGSRDGIDLDAIQKIKLDRLDHFYEILEQLIASKDEVIEDVVISVAGPKNGDSITMTNRNWVISADDLKARFNLHNCYLLNDWEAIAHSLSSLEDQDLKILKHGEYVTLDRGPKIILGPGTGLGAALYSKSNNYEYINATEIGNTQSSVSHYLEVFGIKQNSDFTILEDVLSGSGLSKLYNHLYGECITAEEILRRLNEDHDIRSLELINNYIKCFAILSSEMALTYNCTGGVFIAGAMIRSMNDYFKDELFSNEFLGQRKTIHKDFLEKIPVFLVQKEFTPLYGNLNYFLIKSSSNKE